MSSTTDPVIEPAPQETPKEEKEKRPTAEAEETKTEEAKVEADKTEGAKTEGANSETVTEDRKEVEASPEKVKMTEEELKKFEEEEKVVDDLHKVVFNKKLELSSVFEEKEKIAIIAQLFPIYTEALDKVENPNLKLMIFKWAFYDWCQFVCKHIMSDDIAIKDPEIETFTDTLTSLFEGVGSQKDAAVDLTKSLETQNHIETNFGYLSLILAIDNVADPEYADYVDLLRSKGKIYPKLEELIDDVVENLPTVEQV